jgi:uncharacterized membrane protein (UPF0127 family)
MSKSVGLMFSKKKTLVFYFKKEQLITLHMWFVFYPIDIYYLDKNKVVIEIKKNFKPFMLHTNKKRAQYLIETPFNKLRVRLDDKLEF